MANEKRRISLQGFLVNILLKSLVKKTLFGKRYIPLSAFLLLLQIEYETGAILGRARRDKLDILKNMLSIQDINFDNVIKDMQKAGKIRLDKFKKEHGDEPKTFNDFIYWPFWEKATGLTLDDLFRPSGVETRERMRKRLSNIIQNKLGSKISFEQVQPELGGVLLEGLGFGITFPDLTVIMFKDIYVYKKNEEEMWNIAKAFEFFTPEDLSRKIGLPTLNGHPPTLEEKEKLTLGTVALYTSQYYPELLDPLNLRSHLSFIENI